MLTPLRRSDQINRLRSETFDVLVIGGGATGSGCALDAVSRGLSAALIDRFDLTSGTSSRSTKLIQGGVRYLEQAVKRLDRQQYALVRDALHERRILLNIAPHLTRVLPIVTPIDRWLQVPYVLAGLRLYDWLAGHNRIGRGRYIRPSVAQRRFPMLKANRLRGAVQYHDGQFDDARMNVSIALTAAHHGAAVANYVQAVDLCKTERGRIFGAEVQDRTTGEQWSIRAHAVINACGPFCDAIRQIDAPDAAPMLTVSSGVHIVLDARFSPPDTGLLIPKTDDGRVLFLLPWLGHTLVGTTDEPAKIEDHPPVSDDDVEYLLRHVRRYFDLPVTPGDIKAKWSGLRPLVTNPKSSGGTARISRDHAVETSRSGLITITGGKWTTYRRMARDAVSEAIREASLRARDESRTETLKLIGAAEYHRDLADKLRAAYPISSETAEHLSHAYGDRASDVLATEDGTLNQPLIEDYPYLESEVIYAARNELAVTALDVLARRMRLAFVDRVAVDAALPRVVELLAREHGWNEARRQREQHESMKQLATAL